MAVTKRKGIEIVYEDGRRPAIKAYMITGKQNRPCVGTAPDLSPSTVDTFIRSWEQHARTYGVPFIIDREEIESKLKTTVP